MQTLGPGDVLGWSWLVPPYRWHFGATARTPDRRRSSSTPRGCARSPSSDPALGYPLLLGFFEAVLSRLQSTRAGCSTCTGARMQR